MLRLFKSFSRLLTERRKAATQRRSFLDAKSPIRLRRRSADVGKIAHKTERRVPAEADGGWFRSTGDEAKMRSLTGGETFFTRNEMQPHRFLRILFKAPDMCWVTGPGYHLNYFLIWCQFPHQCQCDTSFLIPGVFKPFCYHCYYCSKKTFIFQFCCWFKSGFAPNWVLICSYILCTNVYYTCILLYFIQLNAVEPHIGLLWHDANFYSNVNNKTLRACECLESGPHL